MSNEVAVNKTGISTFAMSENELLSVLESSLYPGAQRESIKMVIGYCKAAGLDPIKKPVHIVPMWDGKAKRMRDVIMPGIGNYRTDAARSNQYAGVTKPTFGQDVTEEIGGVKITYPITCSVIVKRLLANGNIAEFEAEERWKENYAVRGGQDKSIAPNTMWCKRPYAQLAKCAEAQALRKAFPECGAAPTADEMEGKPMYEAGETIDNGTGEIMNKALPAYTDDKMDKNIPSWQSAINKGKSHDTIVSMVKSKYTLTDDQEKTIRGITKEVASEKREPVTIDNDAPAIDSNDHPFD